MTLVDHSKYKGNQKVEELISAVKEEIEFFDNPIDIMQFYRTIPKFYFKDGRKVDYDLNWASDIGEGSNWFGVKIFDRQDQDRIDPFSNEKFKKTIKCLGEMEGVLRVAFSTVGPNNYVPDHIDENDNLEVEDTLWYNYIVTVYRSPDLSQKISVTLTNGYIDNLKDGEVFCFDSTKVHSVRNNTDDVWIFLVVFVDRKMFE